MDKLFIKPAVKGAIVRHPETMRPIAQEGELVTDNSQWQRYLKNGDVVMVDDKQKKEVTK